MIELNELVEASTPIEVELNEFRIPAEVLMNAVTKEFIDSIKDGEDYGLKLLERSYKSIAIGSGGKPLEVTLENLKKLPIPLLDAMGEAIGEKREELKKKPLTK